MEFEIKLGVKAEEIMNQDFPVIDSSLDIGACIKKLDRRHEACIILHDGFLHSIVSYDDLLKVFLSRRTKNTKIRDIEPAKNFAVVGAETDMFEVIKLMRKKKIDFVVVRDENSLGLITKRELVEVNQLLFDAILSRMPNEKIARFDVYPA